MIVMSFSSPADGKQWARIGKEEEFFKIQRS